jgi:ferrous iron transport protein A
MNGNLVPLSMLAMGEEARLVDVRGGYGIRQRLSALGLNPGMKVTVVQNAMRGPIILGVMDSRVALGRGMAQKILVSKNHS